VTVVIQRHAIVQTPRPTEGAATGRRGDRPGDGEQVSWPAFQLEVQEEAPLNKEMGLAPAITPSTGAVRAVPADRSAGS
jgi:hypothetical protein